jgi:hypothetical protein
MKINGEVIDGPGIEIYVIPRQGKDLIFKARAVLETEDFDKVCPFPEAPMKLLKGGRRVPNLEDTTFKKALSHYAETKLAWLVIKSLDITEGLEWDTVKLDDPHSWLNFRKDLRKAFTEAQIVGIVNTVMAANGLNEQRLTEAREHFLALEQERLEGLSSRKDVQPTIPFGQAANV